LELALSQLRALSADFLVLQEVAPLPVHVSTAHWLANALGAEVAYAEGPGARGIAVLCQGGFEHVERLDLPGDDGRQLISVRATSAPVWVHCTHLDHRLERGDLREEQVLAIERLLWERGEDAHVLCGDMNATPGSDEMRFLRGLTSLDGRRTYMQDAFGCVYPGPREPTWCTEEGEARRRRTVDVNRHLDYIYVSPRRKNGACSVLGAGLALGARLPTARGCASDHLAVWADVALGAR